MISKSLIFAILNAALATGADYAEIFYEDTDSEALKLDNGIEEPAAINKSNGLGLYLVKGVETAYGYTADLSKKSLLSLAENLAGRFSGERLFTVTSIEKKSHRTVTKTTDPVIEVPLEEKLAFLKRMNDGAKDYDPRLIRIVVRIASSTSTRYVVGASSETAFLSKDVVSRARFSAMAIAKDGEDVETGYAAPGITGGWGYLTEHFDPYEVGKKAVKKAVVMLGAKECPSGRYPVVIGNGFGGVLFHESCGHPLEASATAKGLSVFSDSIGKQIASPLVSAFDDGTIPSAYGTNNIDDEGHETQRNQLIKDGICVGFLVDPVNGRRTNTESNGASRRESYQYQPTSRMSNTFIDNGKDNPEDIIKDTKLGLYIPDFGGGSVSPATGEFNFSATEAYIIRDGVISEPVKGCTLIGRGAEVLLNIDRVGNDLEIAPGTCGASSGMIPVCLGQPTIRIKEITVGGRGGKLE